MKTIVLAALLLVPAAAFAAGIEITAKEKTLEVNKGEKIDIRRGDARRRDKSVQVVMSIRNMQPANKGKFTVQWSILRKGIRGNVEEVQQKTSVVELPVGREVVVESDPVTITDIRWDSDRNRNSGSREQDIDGCGVRVLNEAGEVVGEMYKPSDAQGTIKWREEGEKEGGKAERNANKDKLPKKFRNPQPQPGGAPGI